MTNRDEIERLGRHLRIAAIPYGVRVLDFSEYRKLPWYWRLLPWGKRWHSYEAVSVGTTLYWGCMFRPYTPHGVRMLYAHTLFVLEYRGRWFRSMSGDDARVLLAQQRGLSRAEFLLADESEG